MRRLVVIVALMIAFTLMPYVRRAYIPRSTAGCTSSEGSRDRALHGKARRRARKQTPVQTDS